MAGNFDPEGKSNKKSGFFFTDKSQEGSNIVVEFQQPLLLFDMRENFRGTPGNAVEVLDRGFPTNIPVEYQPSWVQKAQIKSFNGIITPPTGGYVEEGSYEIEIGNTGLNAFKGRIKRYTPDLQKS